MSDTSLADQVGQAIAVSLVLFGLITLYVSIPLFALATLWVGLRHRPGATLIGLVWVSAFAAVACWAARHPWITGVLGASVLIGVFGGGFLLVRQVRRNPRPEAPVPAEVTG